MSSGSESLLSHRIVQFALQQLADRLASEGDEAYARSRRLRDADTDDNGDFTGDAYELGYAEARSSALKSAAGQVYKAIEALS